MCLSSIHSKTFLVLSVASGMHRSKFHFQRLSMSVEIIIGPKCNAFNLWLIMRRVSEKLNLIANRIKLSISPVCKIIPEYMLYIMW